MADENIASQMTVYAVNVRIAFDNGCETLAIFSTRERAEEFVTAHAEAEPGRGRRMKIEEFIVDQPSPWRLPVKPVPIADIRTIWEMGKKYSRPIGDP